MSNEGSKITVRGYNVCLFWMITQHNPVGLYAVITTFRGYRKEMKFVEITNYSFQFQMKTAPVLL